MTVNEFIDFLIPLLGVGLLIVVIILGIQGIFILLRIKKIVERAETISDISGWVICSESFLTKRSKIMKSIDVRKGFIDFLNQKIIRL